jgi:Flp pilus assembly secretin CpaC
LASATQAQSPTDRDLGAQVMLQMLEQRGYARVLSEPTLVTMSGKKASFAVGSEIPIVQQLPQSFTVLYKQAGIIMEVTPTADSQNRILTVLHAEVSQPVQVSPANATLVLYRIDTRKADTTLQMNDRQTMVIGGLLDNQITPDITQRVPWFADIPVLGLLFRHKSSQRAEKEVLFFMTPEIIKDIDADTAKAARTPAMRDWNGKTGLEDFLPLPDKNADWGLHHPDGLGIPKLDLPWPPGAKPVDENSRVPIENVPPPKTNYKPMRPAGGGE